MTNVRVPPFQFPIPSVAAVAMLIPLVALPDYSKINADSDVELNVVESAPVSRLHLVGPRRTTQDILRYKAERIGQLSARVNDLIEVARAERSMSPAQHQAAVALVKSAALIRADLACIPTTGIFAATKDEVANINKLVSELNRTAATLSYLTNLPVAPIVPTVRTIERAPPTASGGNGADAIERSKINGFGRRLQERLRTDWGQV